MNDIFVVVGFFAVDFIYIGLDAVLLVTGGQKCILTQGNLLFLVLCKTFFCIFVIELRESVTRSSTIWWPDVYS